MAFVSSVSGRARGDDPGPAAARLLAALLEENHLAAADVLAAVVRADGEPGPLCAALRAAGVGAVPIFVAGAARHALEACPSMPARGTPDVGRASSDTRLWREAPSCAGTRTRVLELTLHVRTRRRRRLRPVEL